MVDLTLPRDFLPLAVLWGPGELIAGAGLCTRSGDGDAAEEGDVTGEKEGARLSIPGGAPGRTCCLCSSDRRNVLSWDGY